MIHKIKIAKFREKVHKIAIAVSSKSIQKFVCQIKEKSYLLPESSIILSLRKFIEKVMHIAIILQEKAKMLKRHFFFKKLQINLSNMKKMHYLLEIEQLSLIFTKNIQDLMIWQQLFSALNIDNILNVFLHTLEKFFTKVLAKLTQACQRAFYHLMCFCKARTVALCKLDKKDYINFKA